MKKGNQIMKSTNGSMTPQATRLAVFALALTAVLGTSVSAQSVDTSNTEAAINRSAPARPAAQKPAAQKQAAPARTNNAARPAQNNARPAAQAARPNAASRPAQQANRPAQSNTARSNAAAHPNTAKSNPAAHPNTAKNGNSRPEARHEAANHGAGEHKAGAEHKAGGEHAARAGDHGRPAAKNAAYSHGEKLHGGKSIPEARFRGSFGRDHQFRIGHPVMIGGQASFQFGGFWFGLVDPWPVAWLYTDAVYVDLVEGEYVLVNVAHPEVTVAVSAGDPAPATCTAEAAVPVAPVAPVVAVQPVVAAPVVVVPTYRYFTYHYWRHYWF
jgi:hypothetical protein